MPDEFTPEEEQILSESPADSPNLLEDDDEAPAATAPPAPPADE